MPVGGYSNLASIRDPESFCTLVTSAILLNVTTGDPRTLVAAVQTRDPVKLKVPIKPMQDDAGARLRHDFLSLEQLGNLANFTSSRARSYSIKTLRFEALAFILEISIHDTRPCQS